MKSILLPVFLLVAFASFSQSPLVKQSVRQGWVMDVSYDKEALPGADQQSSFYYLLLDEQENFIKKEVYKHVVYKILTTEGIQSMSDLNFNFDPEYQELILHAVVIHRGDKIIDQLPKKVRTVQREESMDRYLYDGSLTAIINLSGVQVGDIVEYSFTRKGYNPAYGNHFSKTIYFDFNVGYEKAVDRFIVPASLDLRLKDVNTKSKPQIEQVGDLVFYTWSNNKVPAVTYDPKTPAWYNANQYVMITDFKNWGAVAADLSELFKINDSEKREFERKISSDFTGTDDEYILKAIRFVQDEIRYLGFESGLSSHKPHSPLKVYEQRFGDCKDKSLLLVSMLRARKIEAYPILLNTTYREHTAEDLPSMHAFDHCIVQFIVDGKAHYIDPTINNQGGTWDSQSFPNYGKALIADKSATDFTTIPGASPSSISETQTLNVISIGGGASMNVRTVYTGSEADYMRSEFSENSIESAQKNYMTYYGNLYPDIKVDKTMTISDDRIKNEFIVEENYKIPVIWKTSKTDAEKIYCEFYPQSIETYFTVTKSSQRTAPYLVSYPLEYHHTIIANLPEVWTITEEQEEIETDFYKYAYKVTDGGATLTMAVDYKTKQPNIPVKAFPKFVEDHEKMMANVGYSITYNKAIAAAVANPWPGIAVTVASLAAGVLLILWLYHRYDPRPYFSDGRSEAIGGWLILVAIGLTITPVRMAFQLIQSPELISGKGWLEYFTGKNYGTFAFLLLEHIYNIVFLLFGLMLTVLFFQRRSSVPLLMTIFYAVSCVMTILDVVIGSKINAAAYSGTGSYRDMAQNIVVALIWIPYFNMSSRVRETFVVTIQDDNEGDKQLAPAEQNSEG